MSSTAFVRCIVAAAACLPLVAAAPAGPRAPGLAGILADDEKLIAELSRRDLVTLRDYMFKKNNISPEQQAAYLALSALKRLSDPNLTRKQQQELVRNIAGGIDRVLLTVNDPNRLMELSAALIVHGTTRGLNTMEYWGEEPRTQSQVRPIAEAINRVYEKAMAAAQANADKLAAQITSANQPQLGPQWEKLTNLIMLARFNSAFNLYTLAISIDRTDARRAEIADTGIKLLEEFEDPQYEVAAAARIGIAKLMLAKVKKGDRETIDAARKKFAQVLSDKKATWAQQFEAVYFSASADIAGGDYAAARKGAAALQQWLASNPAPDPDVKKGTDAALKMFHYRILASEASGLSGEAARKANDAAMAVLDELLKERPDLEGIINQQMISLLSDQPDVAKLNTLLLKALAARGNDELLKPDDQAIDRKIMTQAVAAAQEIVRRRGREGVSQDDASKHMLLLAYFYARQGQDVEAANAFLDHVESFSRDIKLANEVLDNAAGMVGKLRLEKADSPATQEVYLRFLRIATAAPFNRAQHNYEYSRLLIERNTAAMQGNYTDAQRDQMLSRAQKAAELLRAVPDPKRLLYARYFEMIAYDQMLDLDFKSASRGQWIGRMQALADEINKLVEAQMAAAPDEATRKSLRSYRLRTALLVAQLAKHDTGPDKAKSQERALALLANLEKDVEGLPNAETLLGDGLLMRLEALMALGRPDQALGDLGKILETRSPEDGLEIVIKMLEALGREFEQADMQKDETRMAELATQQARVSRYLVDRASRSTDPKTKSLLPKYAMFEAQTLQKAARLEKDPEKRRKFLADAMAIFQNALKATPEDRPLQLAIAHVQFDMGDYRPAQTTFAELLGQGLLGKPMIVAATTDSTTLKPNNVYWDGMYKLLRCNVELLKAKAEGFDESVAEETRTKLKQLYIQWGKQPGGPRWAPQFEQLRQELIPDWTLPSDLGEGAPATQPK